MMHVLRRNVDLNIILRRLENETWKDYGAEVEITDHKPQEGVQFGYALNLSICVGCRKCAEACHHENNHDRPSQNSYIRVLEMHKGSMDMEKGRVDYKHAVPRQDKFYMPVQCQQCDNPPCVSVCPVEATWKERDGIVVVDTQVVSGPPQADGLLNPNWGLLMRAGKHGDGPGQSEADDG